MNKLMKGYKVFNKDWTCRYFQYEVGKKYEQSGSPVICTRGFHFCVKPADCFNYYGFSSDNKVAEVIAHGEIVTSYDKSCTNIIEIVRELTWHEVLELVNTGKDCTGNQNSGNQNSGHQNSGNQNSGNQNSGDRNSGNQNSGDWNSGDWNSTSFIAGCFKLLLELYKAIGTPEEIIKRLDSPYPAADGGYAPCPWADNFEGDGRPDSGLYVDDGEGTVPVKPYLPPNDGLEWTR